MLFTAITGLLVSVAAASPATDNAYYSRTRSVNSNDTVSSFINVPKSSKLQWTPCYKRFECANLEVPLDYEKSSPGSTVVAWIRLKATNSSKIDLIFNPGGPGGSGIESILGGTGDKIMELTGSKYNIVSFDPRGVNASDIDLTCFPGKPRIRDAYASVGQSTDQENFAQAVAYGKWCTAANKNTTARYAGTVAVAQDIMHFTKLQTALNGKKEGQALIWYYGTSYGTVIGQTLANLYPTRVGRIVLDANVNSEDHYKGIEYKAVSKADDALRYFFTVCAEAGGKQCAFAGNSTGNSTNARNLEKRFDDLIKKLEKEPLQSIDTGLLIPSIVTRDQVLQQVHTWSYQPSSRFKAMADGLAGLMNKNVTTWYRAVGASTTFNNPGPFNYTQAASQEALKFVTAIDAADRYPIKNVDEYLKVVKNFTSTSKWFGKGYAGQNPLAAAGMSILPPDSQKFNGKSSTFHILMSRTNATH
jgi:pimeloyl-ACP methyl ester carboxylesterase